MWIRIVILTVSIFLSSFCLCQKETKVVSFSYLGIETSSLIYAERLFSLPSIVQNSEFYEVNFTTLGNKKRTIYNFPISNQIGLTTGFSFERFKLIKFEFTLSVGYQNSGSFSDSVYNIKNGKDSDGNDFKFQDARINMDYFYNEFYYSTAFILKTKMPTQFNFYIGYGFCFTHSKPKIKVSEYKQNNLTNEYETEGEFKRYIHNQVPVGIEFDLDKNKEEGMNFLINYTGRIAGPWNAGSLRSFSSFGISIIYKL